MRSETVAPNTEAAILSRLIQMGQEELSHGAAEYLLSIRRLAQSKALRFTILHEAAGTRSDAHLRTPF